MHATHRPGADIATGVYGDVFFSRQLQMFAAGVKCRSITHRYWKEIFPIFKFISENIEDYIIQAPLNL
ncbi:hypothetical protein BSU01_17020 [Erwinia billingiae]|nr:hypothetical protein [Erwinia billingiae]